MVVTGAKNEHFTADFKLVNMLGVASTIGVVETLGGLTLEMST
jgi:hypothetical protein